MIKPDFERIASLLADCSRLREGEMVTIFSHDELFELADALIVECYRRGTVPLNVTRREEAEFRVYREAAVADLARPADHLVNLIKHTDVMITLYCQYKNPALMADVMGDKIAAHMRGRVPFQEVLYDGRRRIIITDWPTSAQAEFFGVPFEAYYDAFWQAVDIDYGALRQHVAELAAFVQGKKKVHITSPKGTDVTLNIDGRRVYADDGVVGLPDEEERDPILNIPSGEVCLAPREDGAEGKVVFDFAFIGGRRVTDLEVHFSGGRAAFVSAAEGFERAVEYFGTGTGNPYVIGELGIGANPSLKEPFGSILMDEKISGTVHLALGDNRTMGGQNASSIHQDMIILGPRVTCDGELLMADGELMV